MSRALPVTAALMLTLSACSGDADNYVSPLTAAEEAEIAAVLDDGPTSAELGAIEEPEADLAADEPAVDDDAVDDDAVDDDGVDDEAVTEDADEATSLPTLPGQGATLSPDANTVGHWQYYPAKAWTPSAEPADGADHFTTDVGTATVTMLPSLAASGQQAVGLISDSAAAAYGEIQIYDSGTYEHANGYEVVWVRFDVISEGVWTPVQWFWILSPESTLQLEVVGDDADTFDDELFVMQGVVNEVGCPEEA